MGRLSKPKKPKKGRCKGCGHPIHTYYCTFWMRGGCQCRYEKPLTKRKRKRATGKTHSRRSIGWIPREPAAPNKKAAHMNELYEHILDITVDD